MMRKTTSTNYSNRRYLAQDCALTVALERISGRWKMQVLFIISFGANRFGAIKKGIPRISDRMLGLRLNELVEDGLILKIVKADDVQYSLTARGQKLLPLLDQITDWQVSQK